MGRILAAPPRGAAKGRAIGGLRGRPSEGIHAVLGGWHFPWPDGDWEELIDRRLIAWTLADSEAWVEVWDQGGAFRVIERIT